MKHRTFLWNARPEQHTVVFDAFQVGMPVQRSSTKDLKGVSTSAYIILADNAVRAFGKTVRDRNRTDPEVEDLLVEIMDGLRQFPKVFINIISRDTVLPILKGPFGIVDGSKVFVIDIKEVLLQIECNSKRL